MRIKAFILLFFTIICANSKAANCTLSASTNWTVASSWSCGHVPTGADNIIIPNGFTVTITTNVDLTSGSLTDLTIAGCLFFSGNTSKLSLPTSAVVNLTSTGLVKTDVSNNSQKFNIGNNNIWSSNTGNVPGPAVLTFTSTTNLPIELIDFTASCSSNHIQLNWSTATEKNNDYFLIESSLNGYDWQPIAKVKGSGTSETTKHYSYFDKTNNHELTYYRLSQIDYNGKSAVFRAIDINCKINSIDQMVLFPNPATTELNVLLNVSSNSTSNTIRILNNFGQIVMEKNVGLSKGLNTIVLPVDISSGSYSITVSSDILSVNSQKLIIIK